jgi:hypothetical protein
VATLVVVGATGSAALAFGLRAASGPGSGAPSSVLGRQVVKGDSAGGDTAGLPFVVSGDVGDLAPGVTRPLAVRLTNPNDADISVEALEVTVGDGRAGCPGGTLHVGAFTGPVFVARGGAAQISLPVTMVTSASPACQGATFPLTYAGSAVRA